jgi:glycosyltransferase involved in cell wall biosynthesis
MDIVCLAHTSWNSVWGRPQQVISRMAQTGHRVLFVRPISIQHIIKNKHERSNHGLKKIGENLWLYTPVMLPWGHKFSFIRSINERTIIRSLKHVIGLLDFHDTILWHYTPLSQYLNNHIEHWRVVYDVMDGWGHADDAPAHLLERDRILSEQADVLFAGTAAIHDEKLEVNPNCRLFTCGVDYDHFACETDDSPVPEDIANIQGPIIGYVGLVDNTRIDFSMIFKTAQLHPEWSFVFVGPEQNAPDLAHLPNVHYLGLKTFDELPRYISRFDIATIPYSLNKFTSYINPTKMLEYMAAGKPVISSRIPDVERYYSDRVLFAGNATEFGSAIANILEDGNVLPVYDNRELARSVSWDEIVEQMMDQVIKAGIPAGV